MTDPAGLDWIFGRFLAAKTLGGRRRRRTLRWALKRMVRHTTAERDRATTPECTAYHQGALAVYTATLCALKGAGAPSAATPEDPILRIAWRRGRDDATSHSGEVFEQITGRPLPP